MNREVHEGIFVEDEVVAHLVSKDRLIAERTEIIRRLERGLAELKRRLKDERGRRSRRGKHTSMTGLRAGAIIPMSPVAGGSDLGV